MKIVELLADAIQHFEGYHPGSCSHRNCNPGNLRDSPLKIRHDSGGYAVFANYETGRRALLNDLESKMSGHTRTGLGPESSIQDLFDVYAPREDNNEPSLYAKFVAAWLDKRCGKTVTVDTKLSELEGIIT